MTRVHLEVTELLKPICFARVPAAVSGDPSADDLSARRFFRELFG